MRGQSPYDIKRQARQVATQMEDHEDIADWHAVNDAAAWTLIIRLDSLHSAPQLRAQLDRAFGTLPLEYSGQATVDGKPTLQFTAYGF